MTEIMPPPDRCDDYGKAWKVDLEGAAARGVPLGGTLAQWIIEAAWAHPFWHSYVLTMIHLRSVDGLPDPHIYVPGAQYEFWLFALQPEHDRAAMVRDASGMQYRLTPGNFAAQFWEANDEAAIKRIEETVDLVLAAKLNPDTDGRRGWISLYGDAGIRR
jgi:hypothetical protein